MKRIGILSAIAGLLLLSGCGGSSHGSAPDATAGYPACKLALVQQLRDGSVQGSSAKPGTRPSACVGVPNAIVQQYALEATQEVFGDTNSPVPVPSVTAAAQFTIPDLTGMTLDQAYSLALASGTYTTPETANGNSPTIANPADWTVCSQNPSAGMSTSSKGIIVTVVDTAVGKHC